MTDIKHLILPGEHERYLIHEMRVYMPFVATNLSKALNQVKSPSQDIFNSSSMKGKDLTRQAISEHFVSFLLDEYDSLETTMPDRKIWFDDKSDFSMQSNFAIALDLGLLSPAIPAARLALLELVNCGIDSYKTAALLSLLYCGFTHPKIDEMNLYDTIESDLFFGIPLQMFKVILPELEKVFLQDTKSLDLLSGWFNDRMKSYLFPTEYHRAEVAILLANLGESDPMVLNVCLKEWADWLETDNPYYHACRIKCVKAIARLIGVNKDAIVNYKEKIKERSLNGPDLNDWTNPLLHLSPDHMDIELLPDILGIADTLLQHPGTNFYIKAVRSFSQFTSRYSDFSVEIRDWIHLKLLGDDKDIVKWTLIGIEDLSPIGQDIAMQVQKLKTDPEDRIAKIATNLMAKWEQAELI